MEREDSFVFSMVQILLKIYDFKITEENKSFLVKTEELRIFHLLCCRREGRHLMCLYEIVT